MTVQELRSLLAQHPDDLRVMVRGYESGLEDLLPQEVKVVCAQLDVNGPDSEVYGAHEEVDSLSDSRRNAVGKPVIHALLLDRRESAYRG